MSKNKMKHEVKPENQDEDKIPVSWQENLLLYIHDFVWLLCIVVLVFLFAFRIVVVSGPSMNRTLLDGDYLLLIDNMFCGELRQGDIVVASKDSFRDGEPIVKRIIATEGQVVDIDFAAGVVYVDGVLLDEPYVATPTNLRGDLSFPLTVEPGCLFIMGDNRNDSHDSRVSDIAHVDRREVLGKAVFLLFPGTGGDWYSRDLNRIGVLS